MMNNIKSLNCNYINLLSHALYKINKMAKVARDYNWLYEEYNKEKERYYYPEDFLMEDWNDELQDWVMETPDWETFEETNKPFPPIREWIFVNQSGVVDDEDLFCIEKGSEYFYGIKEQILNIFRDANALTNMGYHEFPDGPYTCFGLGLHSFHTYGIWDGATYAGNIDGMISSNIGSSTICSKGSNKFNKFFSWRIEDIPEWKEALNIINDFIDGTFMYLDFIIDEEYASYY